MNTLGFGFPSPPLYENGIYKLAVGTLSNVAVLDLVMTQYTAFKNKIIVLDDWLPATDSVGLNGRVSTNGGLTYDTGVSDYGYSIVARDPTADQSVAVSGTAAMALSGGVIGNLSSEGICATLLLYNTTSQTMHFRVRCDSSHLNAGGAPTVSSAVGARYAAQSTNAIRLYFSSGNIASGSWTLYGLA